LLSLRPPSRSLSIISDISILPFWSLKVNHIAGVFRTPSLTAMVSENIAGGHLQGRGMWAQMGSMLGLREGTDGKLRPMSVISEAMRGCVGVGGETELRLERSDNKNNTQPPHITNNLPLVASLIALIAVLGIFRNYERIKAREDEGVEGGGGLGGGGGSYNIKSGGTLDGAGKSAKVSC